VRARPQLLGESRVSAGELGEVGVLIQGNADRAGLLGEGLQDGLPDPPDRVGDELHPLVRIELLDGLEQTLVTDADELCEAQSTALVLLDVRDDEPEVRRDQPLCGFLVPWCVLGEREPALPPDPGSGDISRRLGDTDRRNPGPGKLRTSALLHLAIGKQVLEKTKPTVASLPGSPWWGPLQARVTGSEKSS
jgi:hypothetical protein